MPVPLQMSFLSMQTKNKTHADWVAHRICQLGGTPNLNPEGLATRSHAQYVEGETLADMIREDLVAERVAIETYFRDHPLARQRSHHAPYDRRHLEDGRRARRRFGESGDVEVEGSADARGIYC
ncbi:MAG: ferritin-like domain-containing protein [Polyangiales bacterium]